MAEDSKDDVLIEKTRLGPGFWLNNLHRRTGGVSLFKTLISASSLIIAFVTVISGFLSVANWFLEQKKTRQVRDEERLDRALTLLADESSGKRLAGVISLRSFTGENLSDHFKSGQRLSLQNRPTGLAVQD